MFVRSHKQQERRSKDGRAATGPIVVGLLSFVILIEIGLLVHTSLIASREGPHRMPGQRLARRGTIAVIIDDNGYHDDCAEIRAVKAPITISVLPQLPYSRFVARCAHQAGKEVMLHLPLEPRNPREYAVKQFLIKTDMPQKEVVALFSQALRDVPYAAGVNNHMGSKATADAHLMGIIFDQLRKHHLFFVDSRVTSKTICAPLAGAKHIPFAQRDVFLDNHNDRASIKRQFRELADMARTKGHAIGIGHDRPLTWEMVDEELTALQKAGFDIVTVDALLRSSSATNKGQPSYEHSGH